MVKRKLRKTVLCALLAFSISASMTMPAFAVPVTSQTTLSQSANRQAAENKLAQFNNGLGMQGYSGIQGILYNLNTIAKLSVWVDFLNSQSASPLALPQTVINQENSILVNQINDFNKTFPSSTKVGKYTVTSLPNASGNGIFSDKEISNLQKQICKNLDDYMATIYDQMPNSNTDTCVQYAKSYKTQINMVMRLVNNVSNTVSEINSLLNGTGATFTPNVNVFNSVLVAQKNSGLIKAAQHLDMKEIKNITIGNINQNEDLLSQLSLNGNSTCGELNANYYLLFSASSIYEPLVSYVGNKQFTDAVNFISANSPNQQNLMNLYETAVQYRKPLYLRQGQMNSHLSDQVDTNSSQNSTISNHVQYQNTASELTLGDLKSIVDNIKNGNSGDNVYALVTGKGTLQKPADSNSYAFYKNNNLSQTKVNNKQAASYDKKNPPSQEAKSNTSVLLSASSKTITNPAQMTNPVLLLGNGGGQGSVMNVITLSNIFQDTKNLQDIINKSGGNGQLFMDPFGDIVTASGLVVLPGAANATFVNAGQNYDPYTEAFMEHYPNVSPVNGNFTVLNDRDMGKLMLKYSPGSNVKSTNGVINGAQVTGNNFNDFSVVQIYGNHYVDRGINLFPNVSINTNMSVSNIGADSMFEFKKFTFNGSVYSNPGVSISKHIANFFKSDYESVANNMFNYNNFYMVKTLVSTTAGGQRTVLFDTPVTQLPTSALAMIVKNYYMSIMTDKDGNLQNTVNNNINNYLMASTVCAQMLNGVQNPEAYIKNSVNGYQYIIDNQGSSWSKYLIQIISPATQFMQNSSGVLALKTAYQLPILATVIKYFNYYNVYFLLLIVIIIAYKIIRTSVNLSGGFVIMICSIAIIYAFINVIPSFVPIAFNTFNYNINEEIAFKSVMMQMEDYQATYDSQNQPNGDYVNNIQTASINLYKMNLNQLAIAGLQQKTYADDLLDGKSHVINPSTGLFMQGNTLELNLDKLFSNNPIVGKYVDDGSVGLAYEDTSSRVVGSCVDYYMPYHLIETSFINRLNAFAKIYKLNRVTLNYNGMSKDSFLVEAYMHSIPFLSPGNYSLLNGDTPPQTINQLKQTFGNNSDFLGLYSVLTNPTPQTEQSLWYKTLKENGWFNTPAATAKLVEHVDEDTKEFMLNNSQIFAGMSDENIIKITCLYANMILNQVAGTPYNEMYPMFLNYSGIKLGNVMTAMFTNNYSMFSSSDIQIIPYIAVQYSWFGLLIFFIIFTMIFVVTQGIQIFMPIMYLMLGAFVLAKFLVGNNPNFEGMWKTFKGWFKACIVLFCTFTFQSALISGLSATDSSGVKFVALAIGEAFALYVFIRFIKALVSDITNFGDITPGDVLPRLMVTPFMRAGNLIVDRFAGGRNRFSNFYNSRIDARFDNDAEFDDLDDIRIMREGLKRKSTLTELDLREADVINHTRYVDDIDDESFSNDL